MNGLRVSSGPFPAGYTRRRGGQPHGKSAQAELSVTDLTSPALEIATLRELVVSARSGPRPRSVLLSVRDEPASVAHQLAAVHLAARVAAEAGATVVGADISPGMIDEAHRRSPAEVRFEVADAARLPYKDR